MRPGTATTQPGQTPSRNLFQQQQQQQSGSSTSLPRVSTAPNQKQVNFAKISGEDNSNNNNNPNFFGGGGGQFNFDSLPADNNNNNFNFNNNSASLENTLSGGERTPLSNAIENATIVLKSCEANVSSLTERLAELQQNLVRSKQLEAELGPRDAETKNAIAAFQRLVDVGTKIKKGGRASKSHKDEGDAVRDDVSDSQVSRSEAATNADDKKDDKAGKSLINRRFGLNLLAGKDGDLTKEEIADRDTIRHLSHKIRGLLTPVFSEVFYMDSTTRETQKAAFLQQQADDQAAIQALRNQAAEAAAAEGGAAGANSRASAAAAKANKKAQQLAQAQLQAMMQAQQQQMQAAGIVGGGGKNSQQPASFNPLFDRLDPDLYLIPGIDPSFFQDLLNLRQTRLAAEKALKKTQDSLSLAQSVVAKRRNDGSNKTALRRAEKQLAQAQASLRELQRQKEEREIRRRLEAAAADANAAAQQQSQQPGGGGSNNKRGGGGLAASGGSDRRPPASSTAAKKK